MGSRSKTNTATTSNFYDQRSVIDAGGGIVGNGNAWDQSTNLTSIDARTSYSDSRDQSMSFTDWSDRSQSFTDSRDMSTSFTDWSDRSQTFTDSRDQSMSFTDWSDRSTSTTIDARTSVDPGSVYVLRDLADGATRVGLAQTAAARDMALQVDGLRSSATDFAARVQGDAAGFNSAAMGRAFDLASSGSAQVARSSAEALGFVRDSFGDVVAMAREVVGQAGVQAAQSSSTAAGAYQSAADTASGNKTLIYAALATVGVVGLMVAFKR